MATIRESLRRIYHEIVRRRTRTRLVYVNERMVSCSPPIFILGCYRSGTTLARYVLDSHPNIACPPETDFLKPLVELTERPKYTAGLCGLGLESAQVKTRVSRWVDELYAGYAYARGKKRWADKTPKYIDIVDKLVGIFPNAKFVCLMRHPLDQAQSFSTGDESLKTICRKHLLGTESDLRLGACRYWVEKNSILRHFVESNPSQATLIHYHDLCGDPEVTIRKVLGFIDEEWHEELLRFWEQDHDIGREDGRVGASRGFHFSGGHYRRWDEAIRQRTWEIVEHEAVLNGYSLCAHEAVV